MIIDLPILSKAACLAGSERWGDKVKISFMVDGKKMFRCPECDQTFTRYITLLCHRKLKHARGKFKCPICPGDEHASYARNILHHMQSVHRSQSQEVGCPQCKKDVAANDIEEHYQKCVLENNVSLNKGKRMCDLCGKLINIGHLAKHKLRHSRRPGDKDMYHQCDQCDKKFSEKGTLGDHVRQVHEGFRYPCGDCDDTFDTRDKLKEHRNISHSTDDELQCKVCDKRLGSKSRLESHMLRHGTAQFQCSYCDKKLRRKVALVIHEREHTGERPYPCPVCKKGFRSNGSLGIHTKYVHKILTPRMKPIVKRPKRVKKQKVEDENL